ncbi:GNAT family N-acetyltransferase [Streptomyces sp. NPDC094038]|uniref:GNAT family N-acetyltransferase n=1 Tax=Streptomyces sp. NPDC094038 TaxID=3366055 RepID=UPI00381CE6C9
MSSKATDLRAAVPEDIPFVFRGERAYMDAVEPERLAAWTEAIDRNLELWIANLERSVVVELDGARVGYAIWAPTGDAATLVTINVADPVRRRGLGGELMAWFAASARSAGRTKLKLGVHRGNPARGLYERSGYVRVGEDGDYLLYEHDLS